MQQNMNIVLADDDEDDRDILKEAFEELNIHSEVHTVEDGVQLMNYLKAPETQLPEILFLDLNMPLKNGLECLEDIRNNPALKDIIVIIYSTSKSEEHVEETFEKGANAYLTKPNDFETLKKVLTKVLKIDWREQEAILNRDTYLLRL